MAVARADGVALGRARGVVGNAGPHRGRRWLALGCLFGCVAVAVANAAESSQELPGGEALRVCADPHNMPLSNDRGEGYENRLAEALAADLGRKVEYTFFPQRIGFVRNTLRSRDPTTRMYKCDLIMGVPKGYELTATTQPYMRSTYTMVFRREGVLAGIQRPEDLLALPAEQRGKLRIGVFTQSPANDWLLRNGLIQQAVSYSHQTGDPELSPGDTIERALADGDVDVAIVWGPIAGFLAGRHPKEWASVPFRPDPSIKFDYEISMGVRRGEEAWQERLDEWIAANRERIKTIMAEYRVPLLDEQGNIIEQQSSGN